MKPDLNQETEVIVQRVIDCTVRIWDGFAQPKICVCYVKIVKR